MRQKTPNHDIMQVLLMKSFDNFAEQMSKIQYRPEFDEINYKCVDLPKFTANDLKNVLNGLVLAVEGVARAGVGAGMDIALCDLILLHSVPVS